MNRIEVIEKINKEISDILHRALAGYSDDYKLKRGDEIFIRWGLVERDIHRAVALNFIE